MLRGNPSSSMQKTYDDAYLICSTAIYFEKQSNEREALRSWREALDQIYYHNAYKLPANYKPKTETERALQDSLREMEAQCKERVDLLNALKNSRLDSKPGKSDNAAIQRPSLGPKNPSNSLSYSTVLDQHQNGTMNYGDATSFGHGNVSNLTAELPSSKTSRYGHEKPASNTDGALPYPKLPKGPSDSLKPPSKKISRSPSPDKKNGMLKSTLRSAQKDSSRPGSAKLPATMRSGTPKSAAQAATLAWPGIANQSITSTSTHATEFTPPLLPPRTTNSSKSSLEENPSERKINNNKDKKTAPAFVRPPSPKDFMPAVYSPYSYPIRSKPGTPQQELYDNESNRDQAVNMLKHPAQPPSPPPKPPLHQLPTTQDTRTGVTTKNPENSLSPPSFPTYRKEYPTPTPIDPRKVASTSRNIPPQNIPGPHKSSDSRPAIARKDVPRSNRPQRPKRPHNTHDLSQSSSSEAESQELQRGSSTQDGKRQTNESTEVKKSKSGIKSEWDHRVDAIMKDLPRGVDEQAAKAILNEIVIKGDEVRWDDVAGLEVAKTALREAVVYPFLRPDLFMGLREPARGMLLFGPPGTGKTMLARAVATESKSTFFAISASSLTSKYLGESEKLVRALFALAKALAPSIIFVDEIDSLLSARAGSGEHEATRRIKTEFLIQWSDLAKAAAGREQVDKSTSEGDASRVLVLAATNMPWAIDEAARRRFVRRQYIPLPEDQVREDQFRRLMGAQKHYLEDRDFEKIVELTDGFSGSDITALAKDAAMGPLRSLGDQLLHMAPDEIRPIALEDFEASLVNIRPSVSKQGLKEYEDWAREYGERGG